MSYSTDLASSSRRRMISNPIFETKKNHIIKRGNETIQNIVFQIVIKLRVMKSITIIINFPECIFKWLGWALYVARSAKGVGRLKLFLHGLLLSCFFKISTKFIQMLQSIKTSLSYILYWILRPLETHLEAWKLFGVRTEAFLNGTLWLSGKK